MKIIKYLIANGAKVTYQETDNTRLMCYIMLFLEERLEQKQEVLNILNQVNEGRITDLYHNKLPAELNDFIGQIVEKNTEFII